MMQSNAAVMQSAATPFLYSERSSGRHSLPPSAPSMAATDGTPSSSPSAAAAVAAPSLGARPPPLPPPRTAAAAAPSTHSRCRYAATAPSTPASRHSFPRRTAAATPSSTHGRSCRSLRAQPLPPLLPPPQPAGRLCCHRTLHPSRSLHPSRAVTAPTAASSATAAGPFLSTCGHPHRKKILCGRAASRTS